MGSIPGAYLAAVLIAEIKALCIGIGIVHFGDFAVNFTKLTLVAEFVVMAVVLIVRPYGLLGSAQWPVRGMAATEAPLRPATPLFKAAAAAVLLALIVLAAGRAKASPYTLVLGIDVLIAVICSPPACISSWGRAACIRSATPRISVSAPMARRCSSNRCTRR